MGENGFKMWKQERNIDKIGDILSSYRPKWLHAVRINFETRYLEGRTEVDRVWERIKSKELRQLNREKKHTRKFSSKLKINNEV